MSTICWLPSSGSAPVTVTPSATDWDGHINTVQRPLNFIRGGSAATALAYAPDAADHLTDVATMIAAFVSPILPPQVVAAQQIGFGVMRLESNALNNLYLAWKLYGVNVAGDTVLGTFKPIAKYVGAEFGTATAGGGQIIAGSAVTFDEPWRLVLEVGADGLPTTGGGRHNFTITCGEVFSTGAMWLIQETDTTVAPATLVFSNDIITSFAGSEASLGIGI